VTAPASFSSPAQLAEPRVVVADWAYLGGVAVSRKYFAWHGVQNGNPQRDPQQVAVRDRSTGRITILAEAPKPAGLIAWLRISDEWAAWADYTDRDAIRDWRLRYGRLPDGPAVTLIEAPVGSTVNDRPEFELRGQDLVVKEHPSGSSSEELVRIDLASGAQTRLLQARVGETFGWPSFDGDAVFVESHEGVRTRLISVGRDGTTTVVVEAAASEPSVSKGWVAYKLSERDQIGPIVVRELATASEMKSGEPGEAPAGSDGVFAWVSQQSERRIFAFDSGTRRLYASEPLLRTNAISMVVGGRGAIVFISRTLEPPMTTALKVIDVP
jgi:hypothetical protein